MQQKTLNKRELFVKLERVNFSAQNMDILHPTPGVDVGSQLRDVTPSVNDNCSEKSFPAPEENLSDSDITGAQILPVWAQNLLESRETEISPQRSKRSKKNVSFVEGRFKIPDHHSKFIIEKGKLYKK